MPPDSSLITQADASLTPVLPSHRSGVFKTGKKLTATVIIIVVVSLLQSSLSRPVASTRLRAQQRQGQHDGKAPHDRCFGTRKDALPGKRSLRSPA